MLDDRVTHRFMASPTDVAADGSRIQTGRVLERIDRTAMQEQDFSGTFTSPRTVFRFLAAPADANFAGNAHDGTVMRWIDETAYACAVA